MRRIRWAAAFGLAATLAVVFGAAIFAVWDDGDRQDGPAAAGRALRDARVLVWVGFAAAAGFVMAGRDRVTSEVDRLFEEDRRIWVRRVLRERDVAPPESSASPERDPLHPFDDPDRADRPAARAVPAHLRPVPPLPPSPPVFARRGPQVRTLAAGGVLLGALIGAGLGALAGELAPGAVLGVVAGLLVGLLLDRGEG